MLRISVALVATLLLAACARRPTVIVTEVKVDSKSPPLLLLQASVVSARDPMLRGGGAFRSLGEGEALDRPAPFVFPIFFPVTVDPSLAGPVTVTFDGLDWDTHAIVASGSAPGEVVSEERTQASVILTVTPGAADGGSPDGGASDGP